MKHIQLIHILGLALTLTACAQNLPDSVTKAGSTNASSTGSTNVTPVTIPDAGTVTNPGTVTTPTNALTGFTDIDGLSIMNGANYYLKNAATGNCLDVTGASPADGTIVQPYSCAQNNPAQTWQVVLNANGTSFHLVPAANSGSSLDLGLFNIPAADNTFQIYGYSGNDNQNFTLTSTSTGSALRNVMSSTQCVQDTSAVGTFTGHMWAETCNNSGNQAFVFIPANEDPAQ